MIHFWVVLVVALGSALVAVAVISFLMGPVANRIADREARLRPERQADVRSTTRDTLLKAAGGLVLLLGAVGTVGTLAYTAQTARASLKEAQAAESEAVVAHDSQVIGSYGTAIDQLASAKADERLGGIYGLERVMRESHVDQPAIVDVLCDFVREHSRSGNPPVDILAAVSVVARRDPAWDGNPVDLDGAHLNNAELPAAHFKGANLSGAFMGGIELPKADLRDADLGSADVSGADLNGAMLNGAHLNGGTDLSGSTLVNADLRSADLRRADLSGADLKGADLAGADLKGTDLRGANLKGADLKGTNLRAADLRRAHGLTRPQISGALVSGRSRLPAGL
jgi:hypothetical protein